MSTVVFIFQKCTESLPQLKSQVLTGDSSNSLTSAEVSSLFSAYSNESDPSSYEDNYRSAILV